MNNISDIIEKVKSLIAEVSDEEVGDNDLILDEGIIDSVSILYIVSELEDEYNIQIPLDNVTENNFKNVISIANLVHSLVNS